MTYIYFICLSSRQRIINGVYALGGITGARS